jgi:DNA-binding beta-propeller fold protein YncE
MRLKTLLFLILLSTVAPAQIRKYFEPIGQVKATDGDGDEFYFTIPAGNTARFFAVSPCSGVILMDTTVRSTFKLSRTFYITFKTTDTYQYTDTQKIKIQVKKNETILTAIE